MITKKAAELFGLASRSTIIVQYYDNDFDEWIDMEDQYLPADKEKLNILDTASLHTAAGDVSLSFLVSFKHNHNIIMVASYISTSQYNFICILFFQHVR